MELNPAVPLHAIEWSIVLRLGAAAVLGLLLGLDRELRGHSAGIRTHGIICFATALMTISAIALYLQFGGSESRLDPLRVMEAAAAFAGIIAAGMIVFSKGEVHNLTTAAHMLLAAVTGIACGAGQWPLVVSAVVIGSFLLTALRIAEDRWLEPRARKRDIAD